MRNGCNLHRSRCSGLEHGGQHERSVVRRELKWKQNNYRIIEGICVVEIERKNNLRPLKLAPIIFAFLLSNNYTLVERRRGFYILFMKTQIA